MATDTMYSPIPYLYKSKGVFARPELDRVPEYGYLDFLGCQERDESSVSSRYGQIIVNRDATGAGTSNYFFTAPITTITRLGFQSNAWRYVGLQDGTLQRIAGTGQGAFTEIYTGLSGDLFGSVVTNCFETSQPFLFIYDSNFSIKDMGVGTPQLTGIDPPPFTANAVPYSPLLTLIDNFAEGNSYTTSDVSGWAWGNLATLTATSGQIVTDFAEFFNIQPSGSSYAPSTSAATASIVVTSGANSVNSGSVAGFASEAVSAGETVNVTVNLQAATSAGTGTGGGSGTAAFQYSTDSGSTWTTFFSWGESLVPSASYTLPSQNVSFAVPGIANISTLQMRVVASANTSGTPPPAVTAVGTINSAVATITSAATFSIAPQGMLAILNTNTTINIPIVSIVSSGFTSGVYQTLTVTTQTAHGRAVNDYISVYGSSNDLVDGFYQVVAVPTPTTLVVYYNVAQGIRIGSAVYLSATLGILHGGATAPSTCVLTNQYSTPYPAQLSAWGFYQQVPTTNASFPISAWSGTVAENATGTIGNTVTLDLSINNQVTDDDLIVVTLAVGTPANIGNIRLQFDVAGSDYTSSYYYKDITPAYYQGNISNTISAYNATEQQILGDTLGLFTGATPNSTTAQLQPGNISTGSGSWTAIYLRRGDFLPVGNAGTAGLDWSAITGWQLLVTTLTTGNSTVAVNGLYLQWGYGPSSFAGVGYDYRYTYYDDATGTESNPSPIQNFSEQFGFLSSLAAPFFLRQAAQVTGFYTTDPQVTHVRVYRRGGTYASNWYQIDELPNNPGADTVATLFSYKDAIPDASLAQADILVLDNDPPVTSSLVNPINTTLSQATGRPSVTIYSVFNGQTILTGSTAVFVPNQVVLVGNANNLEIVTVITGSSVLGAGNFAAVLRLQHNAGEPVLAYAVPRAKCNLCAIAYEQVWLAGDESNPNRLYYSKKSLPENFGPQNYIDVSEADDIINAVINWRGTLFVGTLKSWYTIVGGASPYPQPTGSQHGIIAQGGWAEAEGAIFYSSSDGQREFTGADGVYKTAPIEWVYRDNTNSLIPLAVLSQRAADVMCYYQGQLYTSYISQSSNKRYRVIYDRAGDRFRYDDVPATAMYWEKETNTFLIGKQVSTGNYALLQDQVYTQDYDDGGWNAGELIQTLVHMAIQHPYRDLGTPHKPKQWNMLETDVNTNGNVMNTQLFFDDGGDIPPLTLAAQNTGTLRDKVQYIITGQPDTSDTASGQQAYRMSIRHTFAVLNAPTLYQEDVYAAVLADYNATWDSYWIKFSIDESKFVKEGYFDYTSPVAINASLYADNNQTAYWTFQLPALTARAVQRVRFGNLNPGTTAFTCRTWRIILVSTDTTQPFQLWVAPRIRFKSILAGATYEIKELEAK